MLARISSPISACTYKAAWLVKYVSITQTNEGRKDEKKKGSNVFSARTRQVQWR